MTEPTNPTPTVTKAWVALIGSTLTIVAPWILTATAALPQPWPGVIGLLLAGLTGAGTWRAPYLPKDTTIVPTPTEGGEYTSPWPKP